MKAALVIVVSLTVLGLASGGSIMTGARNGLDINSDTVKKLVPIVEGIVNARANSIFWKKSAGVTKAWSQVVAGIKYGLEIDVVTTECRKSFFSPTNDECLKHVRENQVNFQSLTYALIILIILY